MGHEVIDNLSDGDRALHQLVHAKEDNAAANAQGLNFIKTTSKGP